MNKAKAIKIGAAKRHQTKREWRHSNIAGWSLVGTTFVINGDGPEGWCVYYQSYKSKAIQCGFCTLEEAKLFCEGIAS